MLKKPKRRISARARRIIGVVAGLAVTASALALPTFTANADETPSWDASAGYGKLPALSEDARRSAVPFERLPPGAQEATRGPARPGPRAKPFAQTTKSARVVGGTTVNAADYPGVVGIETTVAGVDEEGELMWYTTTCTGTVLSSTRVLTAAHCTVDVPHAHTDVIAGRNVLADQSSGFVARVASVWTHPGFNYYEWVTDQTGKIPPIDDVSVLTLKDPLPSVYTPVTLADQGAADPAAGTDAKIVGYGVTSTNVKDQGVLRAGDVKTASDTECGSDDQYGDMFQGDRMMCAGIPGSVDTCYGDSGGPIFTGGPASRVQVGITDWGDPEGCATKYGVYETLNFYSAVVKQQITHVGPDNLDFSGDGHSDLIGRYKDTGDLLQASGSGLAGGEMYAINGFLEIGKSWNGYTKLFRVNNWNGDGNPSIFARDANGNLFNYRSDGSGKLLKDKPAQIGNGWNMFTDIVVTSNWTGNGMPNLMGRTSDGRLVLYTSNGAGGWSNPKGTQIGTGWNSFNTVLTPGSWLGDGRQSLIGRTPAGMLRLFNSDGAGGWVNPNGTDIGTGWSSISIFLSPGDFNGDRLVDLVGVMKSNGDLKLFTTDGKGAWVDGRGTVIDHNWDEFNAVF